MKTANFKKVIPLFLLLVLLLVAYYAYFGWYQNQKALENSISNNTAANDVSKKLFELGAGEVGYDPASVEEAKNTLEQADLDLEELSQFYTKLCSQDVSKEVAFNTTLSLFEISRLPKEDLQAVTQEVANQGPGALYSIAKSKFNLDREELNSLICSIVNKQTANNAALTDVVAKIDLHQYLLDEASPEEIYSKIVLDSELKDKAYNLMKEYNLDLDEFTEFLSQACGKELVKDNSFPKAELLAFLFSGKDVDLEQFKSPENFIDNLAKFAKLDEKYTEALMCY